MNELEAGSQEMSRELNGLWELNQELQEVASKGNPETDRAIEAKNVALRKLRHARKVIRDLLDERRVNCFVFNRLLLSVKQFLHADWSFHRVRKTVTDLRVFTVGGKRGGEAGY